VTVATAALAAAVTLATVLSPHLAFAYRSPSLHLALEMAAGIISGLTAYLVYGRFRESGSLADLLLVAALGLFAFTNLFFSALPAAFGAGMAFPTWASIAGRTLGAALFAAAPFVRTGRLPEPRKAAVTLAAALTGTLLVAGTLVAVFVGVLPAGIDPALSPTLPTAPSSKATPSSTSCSSRTLRCSRRPRSASHVGPSARATP